MPAQELGLKRHLIKTGSFDTGFSVSPAEIGFLNLPDYSFYDMILPFSATTQDDGSILLLASAQRAWKEGRSDSPKYQAMWAKSCDGGQHFTPFREISGSFSRPSGLVNLGGGKLYFRSISMTGKTRVCENYFSCDYGETWRKRFTEEHPPVTGRIAWTEGDSWVDENDNVIRETLYDTSVAWPHGPTISMIRKSTDGGMSFTYTTQPKEWFWTETADGKTYERSVGEASLVRAKNGWLVAALRTDIPPKYFSGPHDDSMCGLAISVSKDDGETWTAPQLLFDAGRHHPSFVRMPDGTLIMSYVLRTDMENGHLKSYRRGCEALISRDNGLTWDKSRMVILDEFQYLQDGDFWVNGNTGHVCSTLAPDGSILTFYGNYTCRGCCMIRWRPEE